MIPKMRITKRQSKVYDLLVGSLGVMFSRAQISTQTITLVKYQVEKRETAIH